MDQLWKFSLEATMIVMEFNLLESRKGMDATSNKRIEESRIEVTMIHVR